MNANEMRIKIFSSDGAELLEVPFGTRHVTFAIRNAGHRGEITEAVVAEYVARLIWRAGEDWKRQMDEWMRARVAARWSAERNMVEVDAEARGELENFLSWARQDEAESGSGESAG
jgi:hypothetical protein